MSGSRLLSQLQSLAGTNLYCVSHGKQRRMCIRLASKSLRDMGTAGNQICELYKSVRYHAAVVLKVSADAWV